MWECNEAVTCCSYVALVLDQLMVVGHWWNESDRVNPKYFDESLSKCHFFCHTFQKDLPGIRCRLPQ